MIFEKIRSLLAEQMDVEKEQITLETNIVDDLNADSLDVVELMTAMEEEFGIVIADERVHNLRTIGEITEFIEEVLENM